MTVIDLDPRAGTEPSAGGAAPAARGAGRRLLAALRMLVVLTVILGVAYPLLITAVGRIPGLSGRAEGSLVGAGGSTVGSSLLGQSFAGADGRPLPGWFQTRPSAGGWDGASSGASNLGPGNPDLVERIEASKRAEAARLSTPGHPVRVGRIPADAVTTSGSGLDPDISPASAYLQVDRVAADRGLDPAAVRALVARHVEGRELGFLGEERVNVLLLNRDLARR